MRSILVLAALHVLAMVVVRPMFQVSDEVSYFAGVQQGAIARVTASPTAPGTIARIERIAPPAGVPLGGVAGKPAFQATVGAVFASLAARVPAATAAVLLRLMLGASLLVVVLFTAKLAREVAPTDPIVTTGAPLLVALQPVVVAYAAAITPDSLANALATIALWLLVRFASGVGSTWEPLWLIGCSLAAFLVKDTALFLVPALALGVVVRAVTLRERFGSWRQPWRHDLWLFLATLWLLAIPFLLFVGRVRAVLLDSANFVQLSRVLGGAGRAPGTRLEFLADHVQPLVTFTSFWGNLANFGGNEVWLPAGLGVIAVACAVGAVGLAWYIVRPPEWEPPAAVVTARRQVLLLIACAAVIVMQTVARDLALGEAGALQGRWLFPMVGPFMVLLCLGWSRFSRGRATALPLVGFVFGSIAIVAMVGALIPAFYESFPDAYRMENLYLRGPAGRNLDLRAVMAFVERPGWLRSGWVAIPPVVAFVVAALAWPWLAYRRLRAPRRGPHMNCQ